MACTLWFDVEDLVHYVRRNSRPSGIQRVTFEIYRALYQQFGDAGRIRFVRHAPDGRSLVTMRWNELEKLFDGMTDVPSVSVPRHQRIGAWIKQVLRPCVSRLPSRVRQQLVLFLVLQAQAVLALARFGLALILLPARVARRLFLRTSRSMPSGQELAPLVHKGDVLVVLGSPWFHQEYASLVRWARGELGMRFAILVHDIIPLRRPEWCHHGVTRTFRQWYGSVLPLCDVIFSNSHATAADLERYAAEAGVQLRSRVRAVPIGTGFGGARVDTSAVDYSKLPKPGSYALFVSTIEARKNHALLFRVWRRMVEEMPPEKVPTLVFAGRVGWLVADLMQQLENASWLNGKIRLVQNPTDAELRALYDGCLFTLFPSLYEGWGLPVTESLAFGKPCIAANRTSLPEAGGDLTRYFDPDDLHDAYRVIRETIEDHAGLAAWQERVAREFRPVSWQETAEAIVRHFDETRCATSTLPGSVTPA
jgi:glycosyltransferase involved in cell wall biosynthesis